MLYIGTINGVRVDEMNTGRIRRIAIGYDNDVLFWLGSTNSLLHSDDSVLSVPGVGDVIGSDFKAFGRYKKEDVIMLAHDFDISFITGAYWVYGAFVAQIKSMAVESGSRSVVENSLIRDRDVKDRAEDEGGFSGGNSKGNVKGEDKAEDVGGIVNFREIDPGILGPAMIKLAGFVMILPVLVTELKLRAAFLLK